MARVKRGIVSKRKHNKLHTLTKGYKGVRSRLVKDAHAAELHARQYAYQGRKKRKSDFRTLWITRIAEAVKQEGVSYSVFINNLKKANVNLDRKILSDLVLNDRVTFKQIVDNTKSV